jgi:peptide deformylase
MSTTTMHTTSTPDSSTLVRQPVVLDIADDSDPLLRMISLPVDEKEIKSIEIQNLISDMVATMYAAPGVGLAAPQIRILKRIIVFYLPASRDDLNGVGVPLTVLINPNMEIIGKYLIVPFVCP